MYSILLLAAIILSFPLHARETVVSNTGELNDAIASLSSNDTVSIKDGTYHLSSTLIINNKTAKISRILIRGLSGDREKVKLFCPGMGVQSSAAPHVFNIFNAGNVTIRDLTAGKTCWHPVSISGQAGAEAIKLINLHLIDAGEQFIKVNNAETPKCDSGLVQGCLIEYTDYAFWWTDHYYTQGFDKIGGGDAWTVRNSVFKNIRPHPDHVADADGCGAAITFWQGGAQNLVEKNLIINCRKGIEFGISDNTGVSGGIIKNNIIYRDAAEVGGDNGIMINDSPDSKVFNNTVILNATFDPWSNGIGKTIEYRFDGSTNLQIRNNLSDGQIWERTAGLNPSITQNISNAKLSWFKDPANSDLHLKATAADVIDHGSALSDVADDIDGEPRPGGTGYDIGADEYYQTAVKPFTGKKSNSGYHILFKAGSLHYYIQQITTVNIRLFNAAGKKICAFEPGRQQKGWHSVSLSENNITYGVYYLILIYDHEIVLTDRIIFVG